MIATTPNKIYRAALPGPGEEPLEGRPGEKEVVSYVNLWDLSKLHRAPAVLLRTSRRRYYGQETRLARELTSRCA